MLHSVRVCVCMLLTGGAVNSVSPRLTVLTRSSMETLVALALAIAMVTIMTLPVIGAPAADVSGAFEALVAIVTGATRVILQGRQIHDIIIIIMIMIMMMMMMLMIIIIIIIIEFKTCTQCCVSDDGCF